MKVTCVLNPFFSGRPSNVVVTMKNFKTKRKYKIHSIMKLCMVADMKTYERPVICIIQRKMVTQQRENCILYSFRDNSLEQMLTSW
jgi:hypothetical protein